MGLRGSPWAGRGGLGKVVLATTAPLLQTGMSGSTTLPNPHVHRPCQWGKRPSVNSSCSLELAQQLPTTLLVGEGYKILESPERRRGKILESP